ncbi:hypothetical protein HLV38_06325 [Berryella wangjianweii]|uniref:Cell wall binding repeat 2 n=1 Tax=Berryella wangjianweii TaxID=2734634 RepID=A0A6M8J2L8_9ACTN|nr:cell wall-binding repeat-containing protein [Berryella wangjianweii]QKF07764.1 hypothetical protein HLV38_06325 [Berryella wangjianweii]
MVKTPERAASARDVSRTAFLSGLCGSLARKGAAVLSALALAVVGLAPLGDSAAHADEAPGALWAVGFGADGTGTVRSSTLVQVDAVFDAVQLDDGSVVAAAMFDGKGMTGVPGAKGLCDAALAFYGPDRKLTKTVYVGGKDNDSFQGIARTAAGGYVAVGWTGSGSTDGDFAGMVKKGPAKKWDAVICLFDAEGNLQKKALIGGAGKDAFNKVVQTSDGGFVAVGYTESTDGDFAGDKTGDDRDGLIVKYSADLQMEWKHVLKGTGKVGKSKALESLNGVVAVDDGVVAVGTTGSSDGDFDNLGRGKYDGVVAKFSNDGVKQWVKTYGGAENDSFYGVARDTDGCGMVIAGETSSTDGTFAGQAATEKPKGAVVRIDGEGNVMFATALSSEADTTAVKALPTKSGYLVSGTFNGSAGTFADVPSKGGRDAYVASMSIDGTVQKIVSFGGDSDDFVENMVPGVNGTHLLTGTFKSASFEGAALQGRFQGFAMGFADSLFQEQQQQGQVLPVEAYHLSEDRPSMMAAMLHKTAYAQRVGDAYQVTVYFVPATIMGSRQHPDRQGAALFDRAGDGSLVAADSDVYDPTTQVRAVTMTLSAERLAKPVRFSFEGMMGGGIRLMFDPDSMVEGLAPDFPKVTVKATDYPFSKKFAVGGSGADTPSEMALTPNGTYVVVGSTSSNDQDFTGRKPVVSSAFVAEYDAEGQLLRATTLSGAKRAGALSVSMDADGGYFVSGFLQDDEGAAPSGDFAALAGASSYGGRNGFVAKYDASGSLVWMKGLMASGTCQLQKVRATSDGGCIALGTMMAPAGGAAYEGPYADELKGLVNLAVIKYAADGSEQWHQVLSAPGGIVDSSGGLVCQPDGSYVVVSQFSAAAGSFSEAERFGGMFDVCAMGLSATGQRTFTAYYGGNADDNVSAAIPTSDGGFAFVGDTKSSDGTFAGKDNAFDNAYVVKCDAQGAVQWARTVKSSKASGFDAIAETDDGYVALGTSAGADHDFQNLARGEDDAFVARLGKDGSVASLKNIGGARADHGTDIAHLGDGRFAALVSTASSDGDMANLARGRNDGLVLASVDPKPLTDAVKQAQAVLDETVQSADGAGVRPGSYWAPAAAHTRLSEVLTQARVSVRSADTTAEGFARAAEQVSQALEAFKAERKQAASADKPKPGPDPAPEPGGWSLPKRLAGPVALDTMARIVEEGWSDGQQADTVVVATLEGYWDALAASALGGTQRAPILLTASNQLSAQAKQQIERLSPKRVYIVGGEAAVSAAVEEALRPLAGERGVKRLAGPTAVGTALAIAEEVRGQTTDTASDTCVIATVNGYYDALSVGPYAYAKKAPVYLAGPDGTLSGETLAAIRDAGYRRVVIAGGTAAVAAQVDVEVADALGIARAKVVRLAGQNAWSTSALVAKFAMSEGLGVSHLAVADGNGYWDALAGAALCGMKNSVLVLVPHDGPAAAGDAFGYDPHCIDEVVRPNGAKITHPYVFGGTSAVPGSTFEAFATALS